jgi:outer membrane receptor for ferrienterochelin and colicins
MKIFHITLLLIVTGQLSAQTLIKVLDNKTSEPASFATITFENLADHKKTSEIANEKGELRKKLQGKTKISISLLGYASRIDTIGGSGEYTIYLLPSSVDLNEIIVTATAKPIARDQSIYKIDMISNSQIKDRASTNLAEALNNQLSLRVEQNGSLGSSIRMQGLSGEQVKILVDGVPIIGRVNGNIDLSQINLQNTDHVEIIEGPMSVIYGSDAIGGVINIITKENNRNTFASEVNLFYETVGRYNASYSGSYHIKHHTLSLIASRNFFAGAALPGDPPRATTWKPYLQYNLDGNYLFTSVRHRLKISSSYFTEDYRLLGAPRLNLDTVLSKNGAFFLKYVTNDAVNLTTRLSNSLDYTYSREKNTFNVVGSYSSYQRILNTYGNDLSYLEKTMKDVAGQDTQKEASAMVRGIWANTSIQHIQILGGTDLNFDHAENKADFGVKDITDLAAFINLQYSPFEQFSFQPGVRIMHNSRFASPVVYSFNFKYAPDDKFSIRASYAKGFRAPSLKELFFSFTQLDHDVHGNPLLKPETSNNLNLSLNYKLISDISLKSFNLSGFFNQMRNKIDYLTDPNNPLKATLINLPIDLYKNFGSNLDFNYQYKSALYANLGIGFTAVSTLKNSSNFFYSPSLAANFSYKEIHSAIRINMNYKYYGKFVLYTAEQQSDGKLNITNEAIAGGYHSLDAQLSRLFFNGRIDLGIGLKNIFNNTVVAITNSANPNAGLVGYGRTVFIRMSLNFDKP